MTVPKRETRARRLYRRLAFLVAALLAALCVALLWPIDTARYLETASSGEMQDRSGRVMYAFLNADEQCGVTHAAHQCGVTHAAHPRGVTHAALQWCFRRDLQAVSPHLIRATLAAEDERFYLHPGVDPAAVLRAAMQNVRQGRVVSGASTLTMQVVKRAGHDSRSLWGKACQALGALRLEARATKDEILEAYLNTAPYGLNLVGCEAASRRYFGKPARELTLSEAALLAGLPKAPTSFMPLAHPRRALARRDYVLRRMRDAGYITEATCRRAGAAPLGAQWHEFPRLAPHLAMQWRRVLRQGQALRVTLDSQMQRTVEDRVQRWLKRFDGEITNAAAIVVDVGEATVLARVGSADFFATPGGGQFDACRAARSPGSALKPFTYALAMERNVLYASEVLLDDTLDYGLYSPGNFDGRFNGMVTASDALRYSLNVPAITVLGRVGPRPMHAFLQSVGLTTLGRPAQAYGLGLTLGNCEVRLDEMAAAYCMLANLGEYRPLRIRLDMPRPPARRCLSRGTCLEVYEMLEQPLPEEFDSALVRARGVVPRVCWKTGTSTGYRDAWAFVFNRHYVVGVWLGNNSGRPSTRLVGATAALPLAARLFRSLAPKSAPAWPDLGDNLHPVTVCASSGLPASSWCPHTKTAWLPRNQYLHRKCDVHYPGGRGPENIIERWPGSAQGWNLANVDAPMSSRRMAKAHKADPPQPEAVLRILTPTDRAEYVLSGEPEGDRVRLDASKDMQERLHWYLNDRYLGASTPETPLFLDLASGSHKLACMAGDGALDVVRFEVTRPEPSIAFKSL